MTINDVHGRVFALWSAPGIDPAAKDALGVVLDELDLVNGEDRPFPTDMELAKAAYEAFLGPGFDWIRAGDRVHEDWIRAMRAILKEIAK